MIFALRGTLVRWLYCSGYIKEGNTWFGIGRELWLKPAKGNPGRYINHSCNPNAGFGGKTKIVAMRPIRLGEEITIDYSMCEEDPCWSMRCCCGNSNCRGIIRDVQSLSPAVFKKYRNFIPPYFRKAWHKRRRKTR